MQLGVKEAARELNVPEETVYRWLKSKSIPACRIGDQYRFNRVELLEWATEQNLGVSPELFTAPESAETRLPGVAEALAAGGIHHKVKGRDIKTVIESVVAKMPGLEKADRQLLGQILLAREALGSTGIGHGIAIPHVRNPIVLLVSQPMITLCFLEHAVDFGAVDGEKVSILFTIVSPSTKTHLHLLSRLSYILRQESFRQLLGRPGASEEIHEALRAAEGLLEAGVAPAA